MNSEHVKGKVKELKGKVKENVGHAIGGNKLEGEGIIDRVKGKIQHGFGDVKDVIKKGIDEVLHKDKKSA